MRSLSSVNQSPSIRFFICRLLAITFALIITACDSGGHRLSSTVGGSISGLVADGLVLRNNGNDLTIAANSASFQFSVAVGSNYNITVATQPAGLTCTVSHGVGTNVRAAITNVVVVCSALTHTVAGTITGLSTNGLVLQNNGADDLTIAANVTTFQFATPIAAGAGYSVTAFTQPAGLTCTVNNGVASNVTANVTNVHIVCSTTSFSVGGTIAGLTGNGLVLQNNAGDDLTISSSATTFEFATPIAYGSSYAVTVLTQPSGQSCSLANATGNNTTTQINNVALTCAQTVLTASVSSLALAVNNSGLNAALTGSARQITITNVGAIAATNMAIVYPVWPTGTTASTTCGTALAAAASCTITISPGVTATSNCNTGIAPTPGTITVTADDAPNNAVDAVVLSYGCIYQGGFVYSIDDTTAISGSIGGKVVAQIDQAEPYINSGPQATSRIWSSNGAGGNSADVSYDVIPGVDETSTAFSGSPTYSSSQTLFNSIYSNTSTYPFPSSNSFSACNGKADGQCNTSNILALYNAYITNYGIGSAPYTLSPGPTPLAYSAAGLCSQTIDNYTDWHLPAICEMGPDSNGSGCAAGAQNMVDNLPFLLGDSGAATPSTSCSPPSGTGCLAGYYWSSTGSSMNPQLDAWSQYFASSGGSAHIPNDKSAYQGVRCSRALTN